MYQYLCATFDITVDPVQPFFYDTNMNETEVRDIDIITDDYNTLILKCFANGIPKPNVTWHKVCRLYFLNIIIFD